MLTLSDRLSLFKIDCLTRIAQSTYPAGQWQGSSAFSSSEDATSEKMLYLTFDDGPVPGGTERLVELLDRESIRATFFLIGAHARQHPHLVELLARSGQVIGSHSYRHFVLPAFSESALREDTRMANSAIEDITGVPTRLFRPPFGIINRRSATCLNDLGMELVYWGAVPEDWQNIGSERIIERVSNSLENGKLIVLHEGQNLTKQTLQATAAIIRRAKQKGFKFGVLKPSSPELSL